MSSRRSGLRKKSKRGQKTDGSIVNLPTRIKPPQIVSNVPITRTFRFRSTAAGAFNITNIWLTSIAGLMQTIVTTQGTAIANTFKVHKVTCWAAPNPTTAGGGFADVSTTLTWASAEGAALTAGMEISDSSGSNAYPAHITMRPPLGSVSSFWQTAITGTASVVNFTLQLPAYAIVDVHMTHFLSDTTSASINYVTSAGPALGILWYAPLDGTGDVLQPVGLQTYT
jgi:hypothetical protein